MSTKAKIGKDWIKCQVVLQETGETLHLTFAPGQTRKRIVVHVDGRTDTGFIKLKGLDGAAPPSDAALVWDFDNTGVRAAKPAAVAAPKPVVPPPTPAPVVAPAAPAAPPSVPAAPKPVVSEETSASEVQDSAADNTSVAGGKRGRKPAVQLPE